MTAWNDTLPLCKPDGIDLAWQHEIWLDEESHALSIISENRKFQPYEMEFTVRETPSLFIVRFTNDRDEGGGLDRNLGLEKLEIKCVQ